MTWSLIAYWSTCAEPRLVVRMTGAIQVARDEAEADLPARRPSRSEPTETKRAGPACGQSVSSLMHGLTRAGAVRGARVGRAERRHERRGEEGKRDAGAHRRETLPRPPSPQGETFTVAVREHAGAGCHMSDAFSIG